MQEEYVEHDAQPSDSEINPSRRSIIRLDLNVQDHDGSLPLNSIKRRRVLAFEKVVGPDERTGEGRDALEALAKVEAHGGVALTSQDRYVRVRCDLERGESTSYMDDIASRWDINRCHKWTYR